MKTVFAVLMSVAVSAGANELCSEIQNDPLARGYAGMDAEAIYADLYSEYRTRQRRLMPVNEIFEHVDHTEYSQLGDAAKQQVLGLLGIGDALDPYGNAAALMIQLFGPASATINALADARVENISRAEELGLGNVKIGHIEACQ